MQENTHFSKFNSIFKFTRLCFNLQTNNENSQCLASLFVICILITFTWTGNIIRHSHPAEGGASADIRAMRTPSSQFRNFSSFYEHIGNIQLRPLHDIPYLPFVPKPNVLSQARQFVRTILQMSAPY